MLLEALGVPVEEALGETLEDVLAVIEGLSEEVVLAVCEELTLKVLELLSEELKLLVELAVPVE